MPQTDPDYTPEPDDPQGDYVRTGQGGTSQPAPPSGGGSTNDYVRTGQGGSSAPSRDTLVQELDSYAMHQVQQRVSAFPANLVQEAPWTVTALAFSGLSTEQIQELGPSLSGVWSWLGQLEMFGGVAGGLLGARAKALNLPDPAERAAALAALDEFQKLSPDLQQMLGGGITAGLTDLATGMIAAGASTGADDALRYVGIGGTERGEEALADAKARVASLPEEARPLAQALLSHLEEHGTTGVQGGAVAPELLRAGALASSPDFEGVKVAFSSVNHVILQAEDLSAENVQKV